MNKNDLTRKSKLAEQLGMKFEEASELFSDETLGIMRMTNVVGGSDTAEPSDPSTSKACNCNPKKCDCPGGVGGYDINIDGYDKLCNCNSKDCSCESTSTTTPTDPGTTTDPTIDPTDPEATIDPLAIVP